jgi:hypothetical protein
MANPSLSHLVFKNMYISVLILVSYRNRTRSGSLKIESDCGSGFDLGFENHTQFQFGSH